MATNPDLKSALGCFATGVTVITTRMGGRQFGFTANSFTSVSLSPPTILFCVGKSRASYAAMRAADSFVVNVLSASQRHLSNRFATSGDDKWKDVAHLEDASGNAILTGAAAAFSCRRTTTIDEADHAIILGQVVGFEVSSGCTPLVYCRSRYCLPEEVSADALA
jgi:flavin reductase (DIM6/NTAB) family NADH-FMN oxidoreductase RutF